MLTIELTPLDLANLRFGYSPLTELVLSYRCLVRPKYGLPYGRWTEAAKNALAGIELPYLQALADCNSYIPDFLTPTPTTAIHNLEDELRLMREVPNELIRKNIQQLIETNEETEILKQFLIYPREMLECLIEDLRLYWSRTLAHHWSRMTSVLEGDVLYRARQLALEGSGALFNNLFPDDVYFNGTRLEYAARHKPPNYHQNHVLEGQGLQLVPAIFANHFTWQVVPEWQPMVIYRPRGTGLWWESQPSTNDDALEIALGAGRARVLQSLTTPVTTGEIALQLEITAGAASQHLSRLSDAGLVEPHRSGKRVFYHLTRRGEQLLQLFS